ncbi:hypothetical protein DYB32_006506 [Aphanomyces invadans]|uniref:Uncharacterized protein n=1 Tax=Aphanomyces invadans TaxID=157072 RepID=A0A3R7A6T4_9STRA|nr:hypothetical protein DYB32_006506 [Aphanomyces invadans]
MSNSDRPTRSSKSVRSILKVSPIPKSEAPPPEPPNTTTDLADGEEELDESIFSSLRNVDLVSSRAPESARTRELKQKATVNKNVVAFLGGYKGQNSASHRIKVTGDILSRAKSIRKRAAEGQLSRKLHDARMRIPEEFQRSMDADLPRKGHRKRIRFPDDVDQLEIIYVFDVEDSDDEGNDDGAGEVDSVAAAKVIVDYDEDVIIMDENDIGKNSLLDTENSSIDDWDDASETLNSFRDANGIRERAKLIRTMSKQLHLPKAVDVSGTPPVPTRAPQQQHLRNDMIPLLATRISTPEHEYASDEEEF